MRKGEGRRPGTRSARGGKTPADSNALEPLNPAEAGLEPSALRSPAPVFRSSPFALPLVIVPSGLVAAHLIRTRAPERWRRPLLVGTLAVTLTTAALAARPLAAAPASVFVDTALVGEKARAGEAEIGNLIADALRAAANADVALVAAGEIKDVNLGPGNLSVNQILDSLSDPGDAVVALQISGTMLKQALASAVERYPVKHKGFLQVSGMEFTFDAGPGGNRISSITIGGRPLQEGARYRVAMSSTLAGGQYGFFRFWNRERDRAPNQPDQTIAAALQNYLREHPSLSPRAGTRIIVRGGR